MFHFLKEAVRIGVAAIIFATVGSLPALGQTPGSNPIITDCYTADPAPLVVGNTVYLYNDHDFGSNNSTYVMYDYRIYSSTDMMNWTSYGTVLSYTNFAWATNSAWATQCIGPVNGKYYWYCCLFGYNSYYGHNIGVAVSASPTGPFQDALGVPLVTDSMTASFGGDVWPTIDPTVLTDTNGVTWLGWGHGKFYLAQLATNLISLASPILCYSNLPYYTEGPWLHRHGNLYYLSYASSINGGTEQIRYATAPSVTGPWTPRGLVTGYANNSYTIQDGIIEFNGQSYFFYHNGALPGGSSFNRSVCLDYLYYNPDGTIQPVIQTTNGTSVVPRNDNLTAGVAANPVPLGGATNVPWSPALSWTPGSNAVAHAVYLGTRSNAVAQATFASPEYQGISPTTNSSPAVLALQTVYFWRVDEIRGTNITPGPVWSFTTTGSLLAHRYSFKESGGTNIGDSIGGAAWNGSLPNGGVLSSGQLTLSSASQQYARLPAGVVSSLGGITIMAWVNLASNANWSRIFDFGNDTSTYMYLTPQSGSSGKPQFGITTGGAGGEQNISSGSNLSTGAWHQVTITLSAGAGFVYLDAAAVGTNSGMTLNPSSLGSTANNYIGKSQYSGDPYLNGSIEEFRVYNGALTAAQVSQDYVLGPAQISATLPYPWMSQDVGAVGVLGAGVWSNSVFTAVGSGADIQSTNDAFQFIYVTTTGNCTISARVISVQAIDLWSKAGVMIRESPNANAANAFVAVTPGNGVTWQNRSSDGASTGWNTTTSLSAPYWLKLVRSGNLFTGYRSPDGTNWTQQGTATFAMASNTVYVGLAVTSHNNSSLCAATFDNVAVTDVSAPAGLAATPASSSQINLAWNALPSAVSYNVKRSTTNGGPYALIASGVTTTNYLDGGLAGGTMYYYVVSALVFGNESSNSAQAVTATLSPTYGSLIHRYSFLEVGGTNVADSVGGPVWTGTLPNGGALGGGQLTLSSNAQQYISLPAGIVSSLSNFTVMAWVNLASAGAWSRVFDFGDDTTTYMYLTPQNGGEGVLAFGITTNGSGSEQVIDSGSTLSTGVWHQVAVTLSGANGILYLDGVAAGTNSSMALNPLILGGTVNNYLGKSQSVGNPYLNGSLDEFRIYNVGLAPAEIAATAALGAGQLLSTNSPPMSVALAQTNLMVEWPLASAGFALQSCTNLFIGNWTNAILPAPQIVGTQWQAVIPVPGDSAAVFYRLLK